MWGKKEESINWLADFKRTEKGLRRWPWLVGSEPDWLVLFVIASLWKDHLFSVRRKRMLLVSTNHDKQGENPRSFVWQELRIRPFCFPFSRRSVCVFF